MSIVKVFPILVAFVLGCFSIPAATIDVSSQSYVNLASGREITIHFSVWNYGPNNPGFSLYPTEIGLLIEGPALGISMDALPNSSGGYYSGYMFQGTMESLDGSISIPLIESAAASMNYAPGTLFATSGTVSIGGGPPISITAISARATLTPAQSQALFGSNLSNYNDAAVVRLVNLGAPVTFGLGNGYTLRNSITFPGVHGDGPVTTAGITGMVTVQNPEPGTFLLWSGALTVLACLRRRGLRRRQ